MPPPPPSPVWYFCKYQVHIFTDMCYLFLWKLYKALQLLTYQIGIVTNIVNITIAKLQESIYAFSWGSCISTLAHSNGCDKGHAHLYSKYAFILDSSTLRFAACPPIRCFFLILVYKCKSTSLKCLTIERLSSRRCN